MCFTAKSRRQIDHRGTIAIGWHLSSRRTSHRDSIQRQNQTGLLEPLSHRQRLVSECIFRIAGAQNVFKKLKYIRAFARPVDPWMPNQAPDLSVQKRRWFTSLRQGLSQLHPASSGWISLFDHRSRGHPKSGAAETRKRRSPASQKHAAHAQQ